MAVRRVAVLSDTHGYLTALRAVLADADACGATEIVVAGDIVNFGPSSAAVVIRRVAYDIEAGVREFDNGYRDACPEYAEVFSRQVRTGRHYFGPWVRSIDDLPEEDVLPSLSRFLAKNP
jgi:hypothetical protein